MNRLLLAALLSLGLALFAGDVQAQQGKGKGKGKPTAEEMRGAADGQGNEKAQQMRERRDERKQIMEEHKGDRAAGEDAEEADDGQKKEKKPWWKFWGD